HGDQRTLSIALERFCEALVTDGDWSYRHLAVRPVYPHRARGNPAATDDSILMARGVATLCRANPMAMEPGHTAIPKRNEERTCVAPCEFRLAGGTRRVGGGSFNGSGTH